LIWGYDLARFSKNGRLIASSFVSINKDANVVMKDSNVYMPYGSFGFEISDMYEVNGSRTNMIVSPKIHLLFIQIILYQKITVATLRS